MGYGEDWERAAARYGLEVTKRTRFRDKPQHLMGNVEGTPLWVWWYLAGGESGSYYTGYKTAFEGPMLLKGASDYRLLDRIHSVLVWPLVKLRIWSDPPSDGESTTIQHRDRALKLTPMSPGFEEWLTPQRRSALETLAGLGASIDGNQITVKRSGREIDEAVLIELIETTKQLDDPDTEAEPTS